MPKRPLLVKMQKPIIFGILFFFLISSVAVLVNWEKVAPPSKNIEASSNLNPLEDNIKKWEEEVSKDKNSPFALRNLGYAYLQSNKIDQALIQYKKAAELDPKDDIAQRYLSEIALLKGNTKDALKYIDNALTLKPYTPELLFNRGAILAAMDRYEESVKNLKMAGAVSPQWFQQGKLLLERYLSIAKKQNNPKTTAAIEQALKVYGEGAQK